MNSRTTKPAAASVAAQEKSPHPDWHGDEHHGHGGSYVVAKGGGPRRLVQRTGLDDQGVAKINAEADEQRAKRASANQGE